MENTKVPLSVAWLSENDMLVKAGLLLGMVINPKSADEFGIEAIVPGGVIFLHWANESLMFTTTQLKELGFE